MLAQRRALILAPKEPASLQFRDDPFDEIVEAGRKIGERDVEAVRPFAEEPFLHSVGDRLRRSDEGETRVAAEPLRELPDGQLLGPRQVDHALAAAPAGVAFRNL